MNAHLFVVDNDTFGIHIQSGFVGVVPASKTVKRKSGTIPNPSYYGQLSDLLNVRQGDLVFFYLMYTTRGNLIWPENDFKPGYYGIYRIKSTPFFDNRDIEGKDQFMEQFIFGSSNSKDYREILKRGKKQRILPFRMLIEPIDGLDYEKSVNDNTAYVDKTDEGQLSTLLFKKIRKVGQARGITPILPEEATKIARLLFKTNQIKFSDNVSLLDNIKTYSYPYATGELLSVDLKQHPKYPNTVWVENMLVAWIMQNIDKDIPVLREIVGDINHLEFHGNHIQYGISGDTIDILLLHSKVINGIKYRNKATVIEVKRTEINEKDIDQVLRYTKMIAQLVTYNNISAIQPVVIGKTPSNNQISKIKAKIQNLNEKGIRTPIFLEYKLENEKEISFSKFEL